MTILDFEEALNCGKVIHTDINGVESIHTILKVGSKQVNLINPDKKEYLLRFIAHKDYPQYKTK